MRPVDSAEGTQVPLRDRYPTFSAAEIRRRHAAMRDLMDREAVDVMVAYGWGRFNAEMLYLSNWPGGREGYCIFPAAAEPTLLVQLFNHVPLATRLSLIPDTRWAGPDSIPTVAAQIQDSAGTSPRIGLIGPWRARDRDRLSALTLQARFIDITEKYRAVRLIRSEEEMSFFRVAAELTDRSMVALQEQIHPGLHEYELAAIVERSYLQRGGYAGIHYMSSTSMADPSAFVPHQYQSDRVIERGDVLITEISGSFWGYASQIHRTYTVGVPPTDEYARLHEVAVEAFGAILTVLHDGATVTDVLDAAEVIDQRGYTIFDDLLHGADQYPPIVRTRSTDHGHPEGFTFRENMVVTIQPHLITPDQRIGLQFGETVVIGRDRAETLHTYPRTVIAIPV
jgi:Xaa-Pro dipeptidase